MRIGISQTLYNHQNLAFMFCDGEDHDAVQQVHRAFSLCLYVLSQRAWSMAVRHNGPPDIYIPILFRDQARADTAAENMKQHWLKLMRLEQKRLTSQALGLHPCSSSFLCFPMGMVQHAHFSPTGVGPMPTGGEYLNTWVGQGWADVRRGTEGKHEACTP